MLNPAVVLKEAGYQAYFCNYSALDRYFRITEPGSIHLLTNSSLIHLAKVFDNLQYPGILFEDAAVTFKNVCYIFRCYDDIDPLSPTPYTVQELLYDPDRDIFLDSKSIYKDLRQKYLVLQSHAGSPLICLTEAARLISRYHYDIQHSELSLNSPLSEPNKDFQQELLLSVLSGKYPEKGLALLYNGGFIEAFWPELSKMFFIPQIKDYHPEGNAWEHTLKTFQYRKDSNPTLSLALLLHDIGKPAANGTHEKPYDGHSEIGAKIASRFLNRLGFSYQIIQNVAFLVRYHMMPGALKKLPIYRTEKIMNSPLFPLLLELYRADISASYWSPEAYYEACRIYRNYLKNKANPYRRGNGKKQTSKTH